MKIGVIGAMKEEIILLSETVNNCQIISVGNCEIYTGELNGIKVAILRSGIGKVAAAQGTTLLIERYYPNFIINTGSAGGLVHTMKVGHIVIADEVRYHDVDATAFGYEYGQLPGCQVNFISDKYLIHYTECCIAKLNLKASRGLIVSGDIFVKNSVELTKIRHNFPQAIAVDMEATAIAHVCYNFKVPFIIIRAISDIANQQSHISFSKFLAIAAKKSTLVIKNLLQKLAITNANS